jgi:hypothetical protein
MTAEFVGPYIGLKDLIRAKDLSSRWGKFLKTFRSANLMEFFITVVIIAVSIYNAIHLTVLL